MRPSPTVTATNPALGTSNQGTGAEIGPYIGRYQIVAPLGAGGMGTVYRGRRREGGRADVAIKVIASDSDTHVRAIKREFRLMNEFRHPNFVKIYDLYGEGAVWYLVMELIEGRDIVAHARELGDDCDRLEEAFCQLVQGVAALHRNRRLHRDLKPDNILVEASSGRVVILDFGLLQLADGEPLVAGRAAGTPSYMAPEQLAGHGASEASDWYSVGVILWQALTGRVPSSTQPHQRRLELHEIDDHRGALAQLARDLLDPASERRPSGPELLQRLQLQALPEQSESARLLGRETELAACWEAWRRIKITGTVRLELAGEAGLGKTRLAHSFLAGLERSGEAFVLRTRCFANERIPFRAIDALLERLGALHAQFQDESARADHLLLQEFTAAGQKAVQSPLGQAADLRLRIVEGLHRILCRVSTKKPLVIFIDDLQWGDRDSAQLLARLLCEDDARCRVLLVWARRRPSERGAFLDEMQRLRDEQHPQPPMPITRIELEALPMSDGLRMASSLAGNEVTAPTLRSIVEHSQGNPLFLHQAVRMARSRAWPRAGFSLGEALAQQLSELSPEELQVVSLLAVSSVPLKISVVLEATGVELGTESMLIDLQHSGLVTIGPSDVAGTTPADDSLGLYHDSLRATVYAGLGRNKRRQLHIKLAEVLEQSNKTPASTLASHFHAGGELQRASRYAAQAGRHAAAGLAYHAAIAHFQDALAWVEHEPNHRAELNEALGRALFAVGHGADAAEALHLAQQQGPANQANARALLATRAWFSSGHLDEAHASARCISQITGLKIPRRRSSLALAIMWRLIKLRCSARLRRLMSMTETATAVELPSKSRERSQLAWELGTGTSMFFPQQGIYFILESLLGSLKGRDVHHSARGLALLGGICTNLGPLLSPWGQRCLDRAQAIARAHNDPKLLGWCEIWNANAELLRGNWTGAQQYADRASELLEQEFRGSTWECNTARCFAMMALERQGRWSELGGRASEAIAQSRTRGDLYGRVMSMLFQAFRLLLKDRSDVARGLAEGALEAWTKDGYTIQHFYGLRVLSYCDVYDGQFQRARERVASEWNAVKNSDVLVVPSAKLDALLLRAHLGFEGSNADLRRRLGAEGAAHALFIEAWRTDDRQRTRQAAQGFATLGMKLWSDLALLHAGERTAQARIQQAGVVNPVHWLSVVTSAAYR